MVTLPTFQSKNSFLCSTLEREREREKGTEELFDQLEISLFEVWNLTGVHKNRSFLGFQIWVDCLFLIEWFFERMELWQEEIKILAFGWHFYSENKTHEIVFQISKCNRNEHKT